MNAKQFEEFAQASDELDHLMPTLTWETADAQAQLTHFVGRNPVWTVQLVCLGRQPARMDTAPDPQGVESLGTATKGSITLKLTDEQCRAAEKYARESKSRCEGEKHG